MSALIITCQFAPIITCAPIVPYPLLCICSPSVIRLGTEVSLVQALACYLAQEGGPLDHTNRKNRTPLDLAQRGGDRKFAELLQWYSKQRR